jgi:hypothetical protein
MAAITIASGFTVTFTFMSMSKIVLVQQKYYTDPALPLEIPISST